MDKTPGIISLLNHETEVKFQKIAALLKSKH